MTHRTGGVDIRGALPDTPLTRRAEAAYNLVDQVTGLLRDARRRAGLTQAALAAELGVTQGRISQIESGLVYEAPSLEMIAKYLHACGQQGRLDATPTDRAMSRGRIETVPTSAPDAYLAGSGR